MRQLLRSIFVGQNGRPREGWFALLFLAGLLALLAPLLVWSEAVGRDVSLAEQALIILIVTITCQRLRSRPLVEVVGRFDSRWPADFGIGLMLGAALMLAPAILLYAAGLIRWEVSGQSLAAIAPSLFLLLLGVVAEELLFRGFLFQRLIGAIGAWPAQLVIAALFLLTHLDNPGMHGAAKFIAQVDIFAASLLFGFAYLRTGSLALPIGIHLAANATQGPLLGLAVSGNEGDGILIAERATSPDWLTGGAFGLEASLPGLICILVALALIASLPGRVFSSPA